MDSYDAIVEQLRSARERHRQSLEHQLAGALESLESAATSIREALAEPAAEAFPLDDVESSLSALREAAAEAAAEAAIPPPPPPVTIEVLRALDGAASQSDLLHTLLGELVRFAGRAVVLVFRPDGIGAWSAIGFDDVTRLGRWSCRREDSPVFARLESEATPIRLSPMEDSVIRGWLEGEREPEEALLVPISLRGRIMGAVYADRLPEGPWDPETVQVLVAIACWMIDTLKYRSGASSPPLRAIAPELAGPDDLEVEAGGEVELEEIGAGVEEAAEVEEIAAVEEVIEEEVEEEVEEEEVGEETQVVDVAREAALDEGSAAARAALDELAAEPGFDPSATVQVEPAEQVAAVVDDVEITVETRIPDDDFEPVTPVEPPEFEVSEAVEAPDVEELDAAEQELPPPVEPVTPPADFHRKQEEAGVGGGMSLEDESQHEEARRFARLLVSEIKLYNEDAVERGREQGDLYRRLKDDIDRSREMYDKRIPANIRAAHDHFRDELVRILAGGDAEALGM